MWHKQKIKPLKMFDNTAIRNIKESWKGVDSDFLSNQKEFYPIIVMKDTVKYEKRWFDYYSISKIKELVEYIISNSKVNSEKNSSVDMNVIKEIDQFIEEASIHIHQIIREAIV